MVMSQRDWVFLGIGAGIAFFAFTTIGRRTVMAGMGLGKAEINRALAKVEKRTEKRAKIK